MAMPPCRRIWYKEATKQQLRKQYLTLTLSIQLSLKQLALSGVRYVGWYILPFLLKLIWVSLCHLHPKEYNTLYTLQILILKIGVLYHYSNESYVKTKTNMEMGF